ncbi:MAG: DUF3160 domain-containing protein, partial [Kiritimatiellia bacterium]|nr:DUF3160 domain-containing protein [Kiritimatiellia bacterium]
MNSALRLALAITFSFLISIRAPADSEKAAETPPDWRVRAASVLSEAEIEQLARDKILIANPIFLQAFASYAKKDLPPFITSDSLLNAFHVLYEETIVSLERLNAERLPRLLQEIRQYVPASGERVQGNPELTRAAMLRAQTVIGIALNLLGVPPDSADPVLVQRIIEETARIEEACGIHMPNWLGEPDESFAALDYGRFKPRGFYTRSPELKKYFRATSWLQAVPFRVSRDEELLAILLLGNTLNPYRSDRPGRVGMELQELFGFFKWHVGVVDDWDLKQAADYAGGRLDLAKGGLDEIRERIFRPYRKRTKDNKIELIAPKINDQFRFAPFDTTAPAEANFRILSAYRTPDGMLFQKTTEPLHRAFPSGLEVAAVLGSAFARDRLSASEPEALLKIIEESRPMFKTDSAYGLYLNCLAALLGPPEPDAPAFMSEIPWQRKSCQTALAGWAQLRHTWALQAKQYIATAGLSFMDSGFVEPVPEFYSRLHELVWMIAHSLPPPDTLRPVSLQIPFEDDPFDFADLWSKLGLLCSRLEALAHKQLRGIPFNQRDNQLLDSYGNQLAEIMMHLGSSDRPNDVTPRIVDVFGNPQRGAHLLVGDARPRSLYVLY